MPRWTGGLASFSKRKSLLHSSGSTLARSNRERIILRSSVKPHTKETVTIKHKKGDFSTSTSKVRKKYVGRRTTLRR